METFCFVGAVGAVVDAVAEELRVQAGPPVGAQVLTAVAASRVSVARGPLFRANGINPINSRTRSGWQVWAHFRLLVDFMGYFLNRSSPNLVVS
jgi:hypothetical protein